MRRVGLVLVVLVGVWVWPGTTSSAQCVGPEITVAPTSGTPGTGITVSGKYFGDDCIDTGPNPSLGDPEVGVVVTFVDAAGNTTQLGVVDADAEYRWTLTGTVPTEAAVGAGAVHATSSVGVEPEALFVVVDGVIPATPVFTG